MHRRTITRAALAAATVVALAACGGTGQPDVASGDLTASPTTSPASGETSPGTDDGDDAATGMDFTVEPEGQELALVGGDTVEILSTLPDEGESVFRAAAVRPGSTREDMTVVVVTSAEGMYDLRWLEVSGGEVGELQLFPERYDLPTDLMARSELVPVPVWSPDGGSVAWVVAGEDGAPPTLRTIGWSDGPGTGETADDNAAFTLDEVGPSAAQAREWTDAGDGRSTLRVETEDGRAFDVTMERQGDGALALVDVSAA